MFNHSLCPRVPKGPGRRRSTAVLTIALAGLAVPLGAAPAQAAIGDLTCTAVYQIDYSPPLTASHPTSGASMAVGLSNCLSLNGRHNELKAGIMTATGTASSVAGIPCNLLLTIPFHLHIKWSGGQVSELDAVVNSNPLNGSIGFNGTVTGGALAGDHVNALGPVTPNVDCLLNGLTSMVGANQKLFS